MNQNDPKSSIELETQEDLADPFKNYRHLYDPKELEELKSIVDPEPYMDYMWDEESYISYLIHLLRKKKARLAQEQKQPSQSDQEQPKPIANSSST